MIYESAWKWKVLLSVIKQYQHKEDGWKQKKKHWEVSRFAAAEDIKRCGSAVNELTIKPQDEKESQLFWNYGAMTA